MSSRGVLVGGLYACGAAILVGTAAMIVRDANLIRDINIINQKAVAPLGEEDELAGRIARLERLLQEYEGRRLSLRVRLDAMIKEATARMQNPPVPLTGGPVASAGIVPFSDGASIGDVRKQVDEAEKLVANTRTELDTAYRDLGAVPASPIGARLQALSRNAAVKVDIRQRMWIGETYEARISVGGQQNSGGKVNNASAQAATAVQIGDRGKATIESAHFKIERLSDEWQELHAGEGGLWVWKLEPLRPGTHELVVGLHHSLKLDGVERHFSAKRFAQVALVETGWWQSLKSVFEGLPIVGQVAAATTTVATLVGAVIAGLRAWLRKRKQSRMRALRSTRARPAI